MAKPKLEDLFELELDETDTSYEFIRIKRKTKGRFKWSNIAIFTDKSVTYIRPHSKDKELVDTHSLEGHKLELAGYDTHSESVSSWISKVKKGENK